MVIHYQPEKAKPDNVDGLLHAATFIDKYGLLACLGGWAGLILLRMMQRCRGDQADLARCVGIAYAINDHEAFYESTWHLLFKSDGTTAQWLKTRSELPEDAILEICGEFPTNKRYSAQKMTCFLDSMIVKRAQLKERLHEDVEHDLKMATPMISDSELREACEEELTISDVWCLGHTVGRSRETIELNLSPSCDIAAYNLHTTFSEFHGADGLVSQFREHSLDYIFHKLECFDYYQAEGAGRSCRCLEKEGTIFEHEAIEDRRSECKGLCLECVRAIRLDIQEGNCSGKRHCLSKADDRCMQGSIGHVWLEFQQSRAGQLVRFHERYKALQRCAERE